MMKKRSAFGWGELILGIVLIILGIFTFARPYSALAGIVFVYGFLALITGIGDIVFYISDRNLKYPCRSSAAVSSQCRKLGNGGSVSFMVYRPLHFPADPSADHTDNFRNGILLFFSYSKYPGAGIGILYDPVFSFFSAAYIIEFYLMLTGIDHLVLGTSNIGMRR